MLFSSVIFILFFLPLSLGIYYLTPRPLRNHILLALGLVFYFWTEGQYLWVLIASLSANYGFGLLLGEQAKGTKSGVRKATLCCAVAFNIGLLVFYKYLGFLAHQIDLLSQSEGSHFRDIYLPVGISFFTFKGISYVIDVYRGDEAEKNISRYGLYQTFFPQLLAGPISRYHQMKANLSPGRIAFEDFWSGTERFVIGFGKKVLLANQLSPVVDQVFALPASHLSSATAWLGIICYTLQIYFDFSGYTDMAIGIGQMFGFKTPENFNYPYISKSITEFWRRWHITLSGWFRDYLYIPLGGNRTGQARTWLNLLIVFALCGIWHGANWTFLVWGLWNGLFLVFERTRLGKKVISVHGLNHAYAFLAFVLGWVLFRSADLPHASRYFLALFGLNGLSHTQSFWLFINAKVVLLIIAGAVGCTPGVVKAVSWITTRVEERMSASVLWNGASLSIRLAIFLMALAASAFDVHKSFIYFKF